MTYTTKSLSRQYCLYTLPTSCRKHGKRYSGGGKTVFAFLFLLILLASCSEAEVPDEASGVSYEAVDHCNIFLGEWKLESAIRRYGTMSYDMAWEGMYFRFSTDSLYVLHEVATYSFDGRRDTTVMLRASYPYTLGRDTLLGVGGETFCVSRNEPWLTLSNDRWSVVLLRLPPPDSELR